MSNETRYERTRRGLLADAGAGATALTLASAGVSPAAVAKAPPRTIPLPTAAQVRADNQRMVDFGPRLTGTPEHRRYTRWLEKEFVKAGCELLPCDIYSYERWTAEDYGLDVLGGPAAGKVPIATCYTRSQETDEGGVRGPLAYGGTLPAPSIVGTGLGGVAAALAGYPAQIQSWANALPGTLGDVSGSILVVDLPLPLPITASVFLPLATYLHWPGHSEDEWAQIPFKRTWIMPGLGVPLAPFEGLGAAGVVFILDSSAAAIEGSYLPFDHGYEPLPALYVDRKTGDALRTTAGSRPQARLTLTATRKQVRCPSVTAILPGTSDETLIVDTHTDGEGFVEENGGVALVHLARHFGSLPPKQRLKRTLVFSAWPGHMSGALPELEGWIAAHPDLVERAAAALTIEHLGCSEWVDKPSGYEPTGQNELFGCWTSLGAMFDITKAALLDQGAVMSKTALLRPGVQFGVGGAFQSAGVPQIGAIAGPEYLLAINETGDMEKLDARLAAAQTAWLADIMRRIDEVSREDLRAGDPTLGSTGPGEDESTPATCGPEHFFVADAGNGRGVSVFVHSGRRGRRKLLLEVTATAAPVKGVSAELRHGKRLLASSKPVKIGRVKRVVELRREGDRRFPKDTCTLIIRRDDDVIAEREVPVGGN